MISPNVLAKVKDLIGNYEYAIVDHNGKIYASKMDVSGLGDKLSSVANISNYMISSLGDKFRSGEIVVKNGFLFFNTMHDLHFFVKLKSRDQKQGFQKVLTQISDVIKNEM